MALFESYERRIDQIITCIKEIWYKFIRRS